MIKHNIKRERETFLAKGRKQIPDAKKKANYDGWKGTASIESKFNSKRYALK